MRILFAASEIYPFAKTGGLGDVIAALPVALAAQEMDVRLFLPGYPAVRENIEGQRPSHRLPPFFGITDARIIKGVLPNGLKTYVLDIPHFYHRPGPYGDESGKDWPDNHLRFAALARAAADIPHHDPDWRPDVVHGHDWHCGLIPAYVRGQGPSRPLSVLTIHNIAYQGLFPPAILPDIGLPAESFSVNGVEFHGKVGFLKAGLYYADALTTVSPSYADEIQKPEQGCGLDGLLRARARNMTGILNGIDDLIWNPATDRHLAAKYDVRSLQLKTVNRAALLDEMKLSARPGRPVFGVISRLVHQKGVDLLLEAAPEILREGAALIILGTGDKNLENRCSELAGHWPGQAAFLSGYDEALAHRIVGGADAIIVPSRFEPCGLVQLYGLRYGTLPVVRRTGGLADTVTDMTGIVFDGMTAPSLAGALRHACDRFSRPELWRKMQRNAMGRDFSWTSAARKYVGLYKSRASAASNQDIPTARKRGTRS
jgi:starch synthase